MTVIAFAFAVLLLLQSAAICWFFAKRWDAERDAGLKYRTESEVREMALRDQVTGIQASYSRIIETSFQRDPQMPESFPRPPVAPNPAFSERPTNGYHSGVMFPVEP